MQQTSNVATTYAINRPDMLEWRCAAQAIAKWVRSRVFYKKKRVSFFFFLFCFFLPFLAVFGRGLVFFHVFGCFFVFSWWY